MLKRKKGFTLLELIIVVIIIGILATLALPRFMKAGSRARWAAAAQTLGIIRGAQMRYYAERENWSTLMSDLDITLPDVPGRWTINNPAGTDAEVGKVTELTVTPNQVYTIAADGTITPAQP